MDQLQKEYATAKRRIEEAEMRARLAAPRETPDAEMVVVEEKVQGNPQEGV